MNNPLFLSPFHVMLPQVKPVSASLLLLSVTVLTAAGATDPERHFLDQVQPLLNSKCLVCHGPDKTKGGLRLDSREGLLKGGDNGPAVIPFQPTQSLLLQTVLHQKKELEMPPKEKLTTNEIAALDRWVRDGAPWPKTDVAGAPALKPGERLGDAWSDERNPIRRIFLGQRLDLWSLQPVQPLEPPALRGARHPIDRFILSKMTGKKLRLAPEADRRTLARRLYFDLIGLPPTPDEMETFLGDRSADAYERLVDRLLASPSYGEHQGRLWLDVIRYSDSNGFDWDEFRPLAWRFRDYVIRSFNSDKPFDQFVREQIAGDELLNGPPRQGAEQDALIATGYLRLGPHDNSAGGFGEEGKVRHALMADLVETTGGAFLGLTMACCRCHDHKYDPLSQADHYRMRAFFEPVKFSDDLPLDLAPEQDAIRSQNESLDARLKPIQAEADELLAAVKKRLRDERAATLTEDERTLLDLPKEKQTDELKRKIDGLNKKVDPSDKQVRAALNDDEKKRHDELTKRIAAVKAQKRKFLLGLLMTDKEEAPPTTRVLFQGDTASPRDPVEPGFLSALDPNPASIGKGSNPKTTGRRLTFANWIVSPTNPLTARVLVNRLWQQHFGKGLVATPNDFGLAGARPTHGELLDWLAGELVRGGWSVKKMHRLMVTSDAYRRASEIYDLRLTIHEASGPPHAVVNRNSKIVTHDPENALLARQNPRRLTAEQLRDALLVVSGTLKEKAGGPPVWPDLPPEVLQANPAFLDDNETKTKGWYPSPKEERGVRSVYLVQKRTVRVPFMETFDLPENSTSCARRNVSTVAPQALTLMNDPIAVEAAVAFSERVQREAGGSVGDQVNRAFALAFQRGPAKAERARCAQFIAERGLRAFCRALVNLNEFAYVD